MDWPKWRGVGLTAAIIVLAMLARLPYLQQANLSPDATDYINIARNLARGRGLVHSIKWHFFTADPATHSAIGERPLLYPLLLAPFCRGDFPARSCQYLTAAMTIAALILGAIWARRIGLTWRAVAIGAAIVGWPGRYERGYNAARVPDNAPDGYRYQPFGPGGPVFEKVIEQGFFGGTTHQYYKLVQ